MQITKDIAQSSGFGSVAVIVAETFQPSVPQATSGAAAGALAVLAHHLPSPKLELSPNQVPKLTLKLGGKSTPIPLSQPLVGENDALISTATANTPTQTKREQSPELARFSPLVTGPPKPKQCRNSLYLQIGIDIYFIYLFKMKSVVKNLKLREWF